jgi:hypothetical protein
MTSACTPDNPRSAARVLRALAVTACVPYLALKIAWASGSRVGSTLLEHHATMVVGCIESALLDSMVVVLALLLTQPWGRRVNALRSRTTPTGSARSARASQCRCAACPPSACREAKRPRTRSRSAPTSPQASITESARARREARTSRYGCCRNFRCDFRTPTRHERIVSKSARGASRGSNWLKTARSERTRETGAGPERRAVR